MSKCIIMVWVAGTRTMLPSSRPARIVKIQQSTNYPTMLRIRVIIYSDPVSKNNNKRVGEKNLLSYLFCSQKYHKIENYFCFEQIQKFFWGQWSNNWSSKNYITFYLKNCHYALKTTGLGSGNRDPGSRKNLSRIRIPGSKKAQDPGCRIRIRNTAILEKKKIRWEVRTHNQATLGW